MRRTHCENLELHARPKRALPSTVRCLRATRLLLQRSTQSEVRRDQLDELLLLRTVQVFSQPLHAVVSNAPANNQLSSLESRMLSLPPDRCRAFRVALPATEKMSGLCPACHAGHRNKNGKFLDHQNSPYASRNAAREAQRTTRGSAADRWQLQ